MRIKHILIFALLLIFLSSCIKGALKHTITGKVLKDGKPTSGTVRVIDPKDMSTISESKTLEGGGFVVREIPIGEWLIALTGRTGGAIGNYHYLKLGKLGKAGDFIFDVSEVDPKAQELMAKYHVK